LNGLAGIGALRDVNHRVAVTVALDLVSRRRPAAAELITWVDDKCYWTTHGITTFGMPQTSKVCKDPPKPDSELFKDMRKKLDERPMGRAP
jgi:hypothetical protein